MYGRGLARWRCVARSGSHFSPSFPCGPKASCHATDRIVAPPKGLSTLGFGPARFRTEPPACYRASWQLPGPDFHRQATTSLRTRKNTMPYVTVPPPALLGAHNGHSAPPKAASSGDATGARTAVHVLGDGGCRLL